MFPFFRKEKTINNQPLTVFDWFKHWGGGWFGGSVKKETALKINMFYACVRILSQAVATTPINIINKNNQTINNDLQFLLKHKPNNNQTAFDFWAKIMFDLLIFGNAYVLKNYAGGEVVALSPICPEFVQIERRKNGALLYKITAGETIKNVNQSDIIHYKMLSLDGVYGVAPIDLLINSFFVNQKLNKFLEIDNFPPVLKTPEELLQDEQVQTLAEQVGDKLTQSPFVLPAGFELILSNSHSAFDKKFAELKKFTNEEIARFFGIPFGLVGLDGASQPNVLDTQNRLFLQQALNPYLRMIEQTTEAALFSRAEIAGGDRIKFNRNALILQTDAVNRADFYKKMLDLGVYNVDKIKQLEDIY